MTMAQASSVLMISFRRQVLSCISRTRSRLHGKQGSPFTDISSRMPQRFRLASCHNLPRILSTGSTQSTSSWSLVLSRSYGTRHHGQQGIQKFSSADEYEDNEEEEETEKPISILKLFQRLRNEYVTNLMEGMAKDGDADMSVQDWEDIERNIAENFDENTTFRKYWSTQVMAFFNNLLFIRRATSLLDYVTLEKAHVAILRQFIQLLSKCDYSSQQEGIYKVYNVLKPQLDLLDFDTLTMVIQALCKTERWKESLELLTLAEKLERPTPNQLSAVGGAAVRAGEFELVESILDKMGEKHVPPQMSVYKEILGVEDLETGYDLLRVMFKHMGKNAWYPSEVVINDMKEWFEKRNPGGLAWKASLTHVSKRGICEHCQHVLKKVHITEKDFQSLRDTFLEKSLIGHDVFVNTTPQELQEFQAFLKQNGPYDVVIDGLNVIHRSRRANYDHLLSVAEECWQRGKRSLVLIRAHTKKSRVLSQVQERADVFFAKNISSDDPFLLYAALDSGKNTRIITADEMRDHRFLLGQKMAEFFKVWQRASQIVYDGMIMKGPKRGSARLKFPPKHQVCPQEHNGGWHIPYDDGSERVSYECPDTWLCVRSDGR